jgi:UDP-N-acetylmuramoyl-L-alanyl-D-glutamate--2,6-diaminopimelate ligase
MTIGELFDGLDAELIRGSGDVVVSGINIDSRLVKPGDLFVAIKGRLSDGHDYIEDVISKGAVAILVSEIPAFAGMTGGVGMTDSTITPTEDTTGEFLSARDERAKENLQAVSPDIAIIKTSDPRNILSELTERLAGWPSRKLKLIGVTGTNGKTSTATTIDHILRGLGLTTGLIGTVDNYCAGEVLDVKMTTSTTPDCVELSEIFTKMADANVEDLTMEVSSMGITTGRVKALEFDVGIFTNISPEHLDDHGDMDTYKEAKASLFAQTKKAALNLDDPFAKEILAKYPVEETILFGINDGGSAGEYNLYAENIEYSASGLMFDAVYLSSKGQGIGSWDFAQDDGQVRDDGDVGNAKWVRVRLSTPAEFAVYNSLAAMAACLLLGEDFYEIAEAVSKPYGVPGRYELVSQADSDISVIVDYAHTAKALENLLQTARKNTEFTGIISVFGCGGDRDSSKRAPMGETSGRLADYSIITSDNPRSENPYDIIAQAEIGVKQSGGKYEIIEDRHEAIRKAIRMAKQGNVVIISGKGHEDYQEVGGEKKPFDDREEALAALAERQ